MNRNTLNSREIARSLGPPAINWATLSEVGEITRLTVLKCKSVKICFRTSYKFYASQS